MTSCEITGPPERARLLAVATAVGPTLCLPVRLRRNITYKFTNLASESQMHPTATPEDATVWKSQAWCWLTDSNWVCRHRCIDNRHGALGCTRTSHKPLASHGAAVSGQSSIFWLLTFVCLELVASSSVRGRRRTADFRPLLSGKPLRSAKRFSRNITSRGVRTSSTCYPMPQPTLPQEVVASLVPRHSGDADRLGEPRHGQSTPA